MAGLARANGRPQRQAKPLTETALAAVKATAGIPRRYRGRAVRAENAWDARRRGQVDIALLSVLRDGLLRRSEAAALRWGDMEIQEDGSARLHVRRSKTDPEAEGAALYIGSDAASALVAIMSEGFAVVDPSTPVFGLSASQIGRRVNAAAKAAGLGPGGRGGGVAEAGASGPVEELLDAGSVHRAPGGREGRGGQVLPEERRLTCNHLSPGDMRGSCTGASTCLVSGTGPSMVFPNMRISPWY